MRCTTSTGWCWTPTPRQLRHDARRTGDTGHVAKQPGAGPPCDYDPPSDARQQNLRNHMDWTVVAARYRFPPIKDNER
ncbi:hypothetical protein [Roseovarius sp. ZX-A-9]|uniref:hypothetical protein n=1 Tax=Roseovarius sp. ZX-A-9 TaxID=3014783 RepID=UPI00232C43CD|nr:hypothetical protein [Roseovarius sp. ZX-A-9]